MWRVGWDPFQLGPKDPPCLAPKKYGPDSLQPGPRSTGGTGVLTAPARALLGGADNTLNMSLASEPGGVAWVWGNGRWARSKCGGPCHLLSGKQEWLGTLVVSMGGSLAPFWLPITVCPCALPPAGAWPGAEPETHPPSPERASAWCSEASSRFSILREEGKGIKSG